MSLGTRLAVVIAGLAVGCASTSVETDKARPGDPSVHGDAAPDPRSVKVTLYPFWEVPVDANGFGEPIPLDGVKICVARQRPFDAPWSAFVDTTGPCAPPTVAGDNPVLVGVPGSSELIITAEKDGYQPRALAVTTGEWDLDVTAAIGAADSRWFSLFREGDWEFTVDPSVAASPRTGVLVAMPVVWVQADGGILGLRGGFLGEVRISLDPADGNGPYYSLGGKWIPDATATAPGYRFIPGAQGSMHVNSRASFINVPEGEYHVKFEQPNAFCSVIGRSGDSVYGFSSSAGTVRAPVLAGHTTAVAVLCSCKASADPIACAPHGDAGVL